MLFGEDRDALRQMYADAWLKRLNSDIMSPLESQIARVIEEHPEYHAIVTAAEADAEFTPEGGQSNPFLHMGLHLSIREQVTTDRPAGIRLLFDALATNTGAALEAEHRMMECLAETLWEAQRNNVPPDEQLYLQRLKAC
jgi:hypothetical protein